MVTGIRVKAAFDLSRLAGDVPVARLGDDVDKRGRDHRRDRG
jgi:hypothetical protein